MKRYLKKFKEFEMLLYCSNKWYRDTIYHQLWFYFVAEYVFSKYEIMKNLLDKKDWYCEPVPEIIKEGEISREKARYALICVIALCHDLGKPLQKIHNINNAISSMLKEYQFLHFNPFKIEFPLTYEPMLNFLVERLGQFGDPARSNKKLVFIKDKNKDPKDEEHKKDITYYIKMDKYSINQPHMKALYGTALTELNHGMLSCLLLMESFRRFKGGAPYKLWKIEDNKEIRIQKAYMTAQSILKPIANHSFEGIKITEIDIPYFWICLIDDLIECYRPTRAGQDFISSRLCEARIIEMTLEKIHICYTFDNKITDLDDAIHFLVEKIVKYYNILDLEIDLAIEVNYSDYIMRFIYNRDKEKRSLELNDKQQFNNEYLINWLLNDKSDWIKNIKFCLKTKNKMTKYSDKSYN